MADSTISVSFSASVGDLVSGISEARDALSTLVAPSQQLNTQYSDLRVSMSRAFDAAPLTTYGASLSEISSRERALGAIRAQASEAVRTGDQAASEDAVAAAEVATRGEVRAVQDGLKEKMAALNDELGMHKITMDEKVAQARAALDEEHSAELSYLQSQEQLGSLTLDQKAQLLVQELAADRRYQQQQGALTRQSLDAQSREYESFGTSISSAFNGQLRGLLSGTESWRKAFSNTLETLTIDFIEFSEKSVIQYLAGEATKTAATTAGVAARTGAEQAGAAASLATQGAAMVRSILSSAAESFAGVFGFLSPLLGPAAAGPAAGAYGAVAGMAGAVASADIGMWQVPQDMLTLVHHNELIMPAAQAGSFRSMLDGGGPPGSGNVSVNPTTHLHVNALDGASVSQFMRNNSGSMLKAIDEAVRHGAHLGTRRLRPT
jgi:hypothetical protein